MKRRVFIIVYVVFVFLTVSVHYSFGVTVTNPYCATPPFIQAKVPSNVMLVLDYSGSMSWNAYADTDSSGATYWQWVYTNNGWAISYYHPNKTYYGYFIPDKYYSYSNRYSYYYISSNGRWSGSYLNWLYMTRIDILRWILTGGALSRRGNYVVTSEGVYIKKQDVSSYNPQTGEVEGILQEIERSKTKPRIGAIFFSTTVFDTIGLSYDYSDLIYSINHNTPGGSTATHLGVEYALNMYEENSYYIDRFFEGVDPYKFLINGETVSVPCAKNFVILMSDGEWNTSDDKSWCYTTNCDPIRPIDKMWKGGNADLVSSLAGNQNVRTYTVSMFADPTDSGTNALKWMAVYGNYEDLDGNGYPCDQKSYPVTSLTAPETLEASGCPEVKENSDKTGPYGFFVGQNPAELKNSIIGVFNEILRQISSGTATSVLSEKERVDMGIIQAAFYPQRTFIYNGSEYQVDWVGSLFSWWFYTGYTPNGYVSNIREDTIENKALDICSNGQPGGDYIISYDFVNNKLQLKGYKSTCEGTQYSSIPAVVYNNLNEAHFVWDAGKKLSETSPFDRVIYTYTGNLQPRSEEDLQQLKDLVNTPTRQVSKLFGDDNGNGEIDESTENYVYVKSISFSDLKDYIYGEDIAGYRSRYIGDNETWKLGDITYSTPQIVNYDNFSVAFVGANDGMLHAFLVGKYRYDNLGLYQATKLRNNSFSDSTNELGEELWAFIPKNMLPYLRFLADPSYCHMYFVDLTPYIIQIKDKWGSVVERILIGGMRLGGAVGSDNATVSVNPPKDTCPNPTNYNPAYDPSTSPAGCLGLSSYFALDITNPLHPKFLWEFTNPYLGFTYSGPAFIKRKDATGQWHYYVMFVSGPTDYKGDVGQDLRVFVLSLNPDFTINTVYSKDLSVSLGLGDAFGGRLFTDGIVANNGETKAVFFGVSQYANGEWIGNVVGVKPIDTNPSDWIYFKLFPNPIQPIVAPITYESCFGKNFLYFGTGRYFYKEDTPDGSVNKLYGVEIDSCLDNDKPCSVSTLISSTDPTICYDIGSPGYAWYQDLLPAGNGYNKERSITAATPTGENVVYFTTMQPTSNVCGFGGRTRIWGLNCATGESLIYQNCQGYITGKIEGALLLQTSVGEISKFNVNIAPNNPNIGSNPFTAENSKATSWKVGTAPPNRSNYVKPRVKKPVKILYEIEN